MTTTVDLANRVVTRTVTVLPRTVALVELDEPDQGSEYAIVATCSTSATRDTVLVDPTHVRISLHPVTGQCESWCHVCDDVIATDDLVDWDDRDTVTEHVLQHLLGHHEGTAIAQVTLVNIGTALAREDDEDEASWVETDEDYIERAQRYLDHVRITRPHDADELRWARERVRRARTMAANTTTTEEN